MFSLMICHGKTSVEGNAPIAVRTVGKTNKHTNARHLLCAKMADAWATQLITSLCARDENSLYTCSCHVIVTLIKPDANLRCVLDIESFNWVSTKCSGSSGGGWSRGAGAPPPFGLEANFSILLVVVVYMW